MSVMYYPSFVPEEGKRYVRAYDTGNGIRRIKDTVIIYHNTLIISDLYDTAEEALRSWGEYSRKEVELPDGTVTTPIERFHPDEIDCVLIPWHPGIVELWPVDAGY